MNATLPNLIAQRVILLDRLHELTPHLQDTITQAHNPQYDYKVAYHKLAEVNYQIRKITVPAKPSFWKKFFPKK